MQILRSLADPALIELLAGALNDSDSEVRREAASALGDLKDDGALHALIGAVRDPVEPVQEAAIQALERQGEMAAVGPLVSALLHGTPTIQWRAAHALKVLQWRPRTEAEEIQSLVAMGEIERTLVFGAAAVNAVAAVLKTGSYEKRVAAVNVLGEINEPTVIKPLQDALRDPDALVRTAVAYALARVGGPQVVPGLIHALKDNDRNVRVAVAVALGKLSDARAVEPLILLLKDKEWEVRAAALESLGRLGDARAFKPVAERLDDKDQEVRQYAVDAVAQVGDESIIEKLVLTMVDGHSGVRQAAARALPRLDPYWDRSERVQRLLPTLQTAARNKDSAVQFAASNLLKRLSGRSSSEGTLALARSEVERKRHTIVTILQDLLRDRDAEVRLAAVESIARLELTACVDAVKAAAEDADGWVKAAAQQTFNALAKLPRACAQERG
ncbi:MAG: HEAT repeat domain-containing protein [Verrucomicrobia bacterium]|nr:HEAT repeat domain-containing protein [Verrucomicrobiota bacterium]